jgi:hypothetical protein
VEADPGALPFSSFLASHGDPVGGSGDSNAAIIPNAVKFAQGGRLPRTSKRRLAHEGAAGVRDGRVPGLKPGCRGFVGAGHNVAKDGDLGGGPGGAPARAGTVSASGTDPTGRVSVTVPSQPEPAPVDCNEEVVVADRKEMANGSGLALSDPGKKMQ